MMFQPTDPPQHASDGYPAPTSSRALAATIGAFAQPAEPISGRMPCPEVDRLFADDAILSSLVVRLEDGALALLTRSEFEYAMSGARGFGRWLHANSMVGRLVQDAQSLTLASSTSLYDAHEALLQREWRSRFSDILVTYPDGHVGILRAGVLLEAVARQHASDAVHDHLTGLANRALLTSRLAEALSRSGARTALLFIDMDRFKVINDSIGHDAGDTLLGMFADRLQRCVRREDTAARLGGDEFAVVVEEVVGDEAVAVATRLLDSLRMPFPLGEHGIVVNASIGIAVADAEDDAAALLRKADLAMYQAKRAGGGRFQYFRGDLERAARDRLDIEVWLRRALSMGEGLEVYFQPIVALGTFELTGFEALVRGQHPERGLLGPADFLTVAEETGLIANIDLWVLREACKHLQRWQPTAPEGTRLLALNVNVSPRLLERLSVGDEVAVTIVETGIDPHRLQIEVTEGSMVKNLPHAIRALNHFRRLGVRVAVDDFGTGYSSLNHLSKLPIDALKIDASFVARATAGRNDAAIIRLIIALANAMQVETIAEGVEQIEQATLLREMDCQFAQGYHFARPMPSAEVTRMLAEATGAWRLPWIPQPKPIDEAA